MFVNNKGQSEYAKMVLSTYQDSSIHFSGENIEREFWPTPTSQDTRGSISEYIKKALEAKNDQDLVFNSQGNYLILTKAQNI
jgi:hypothetical protein